MKNKKQITGESGSVTTINDNIDTNENTSDNKTEIAIDATKNKKEIV